MYLWMLSVILPLLCLLAFASFLFPDTGRVTEKYKHCGSSLCGNINITYPFRLKTQSHRCGNKELELVCQNNRTIFPMKHGNFYVQHISYSDETIQLLDESLGNDNCSIPHSSYPWYTSFSKKIYLDRTTSEYSIMYLVNCTMQINYTSVYIDAFRCTNNTASSRPAYFYFLDGNTTASDFDESCRVEAQVPIMLANITGRSTFDIYTKLLTGFQLSWSTFYYDYVWLSWDSIVNIAILAQAVDAYAGNTYSRHNRQKLKRRHLSVDDDIENFLQSQNNLMPIRYSYSEIKRMTDGFKNKLGQGGYGYVFKGKLRSGQLVAIKLLNNSKANGQDFINEVATIGRIHHVNVVRLIGFCVKGSKQALVYDFMKNGSLDKIIFSAENNTLSWQKMFEIALGVARGIEYLHRGCEMQILHFDIKPRNILLDENFTPKVSDFGLAKLYSVDNDIISLTAARGTVGYMAPELFYKNLGGISYKADVYSFGMMLMEITGRRKNLNASAEQSSQIYFPSWIYDRLDEGDIMDLGDLIENENKIMRKMVIVALWCIQMKPTDRPSMSKVLNMLESEVELLEMPPKPSFSGNVN
ncbi:PR5-like receptor kinase [Theobroma cacao]|uniref:PR5-like receptor kinase n=1 Tax=Theobroma cacao TaxID=3641 RepID=A0A061F7Z6_THECC|nr:PR5-like receptor kinase [Theobroma cacao]